MMTKYLNYTPLFLSAILALNAPMVLAMEASDAETDRVQQAQANARSLMDSLDRRLNGMLPAAQRSQLEDLIANFNVSTLDSHVNGFQGLLTQFQAENENLNQAQANARSLIDSLDRRLNGMLPAAQRSQLEDRIANFNVSTLDSDIQGFGNLLAQFETERASQ